MDASKPLPIEPDHLRELIRSSYDSGDMVPELPKLVLNIVEGYLAGHNIRFRFGDSVADDILSGAVIKCLTAIHNKTVDLDYNPFNYFTRITANEANKEIVRHCQRSADLKYYLEEEDCNGYYTDQFDFDTPEKED